MLFKDAQDLLLDLAVGGTVEGDPDRVVAVLHLQGREVLEVLGEFAVVIVADVEIGEDLDQTGADLAEAGLLALCVIVCDDADNGSLDRGLVCKGSLGIAVKILIGIRFLLDLCRGRRGFIGSCGLRDRGSFSSGSGLLRGAAPGAFRGTAGRGFGGVNLGIGTVGIRARALASGISRVDDVEEYETLAGSAEGLRRLLLAHSYYEFAGLAQSGGQFIEIAVAGYEAESLHIAGVEDVHRVDDQADVGGVLAGSVVGLHDGGQREAGRAPHPGVEAVLGPVAVHAADRDLSIF